MGCFLEEFCFILGLEEYPAEKVVAVKSSMVTVRKCSMPWPLGVEEEGRDMMKERGEGMWIDKMPLNLEYRGPHSIISDNQLSP